MDIDRAPEVRQSAVPIRVMIAIKQRRGVNKQYMTIPSPNVERCKTDLDWRLAVPASTMRHGLLAEYG
jgi:hypothetical protein